MPKKEVNYRVALITDRVQGPTVRAKELLAIKGTRRSDCGTTSTLLRAFPEDILAEGDRIADISVDDSSQELPFLSQSPFIASI